MTAKQKVLLDRAGLMLAAMYWVAWATFCVRGGNALVMGAFAAVALWHGVIRDLYQRWTGRYYSVVVFVNGKVFLAERCTFAWSANQLGRTWQRRYSGLTASTEGETQEPTMIVVAGSNVTDTFE